MYFQSRVTQMHSSFGATTYNITHFAYGARGKFNPIEGFVYNKINTVSFDPVNMFIQRI